MYTRPDQIRGILFGPQGMEEAYLVASVFVGSCGLVVYKRTGGGTRVQEVARNKDVPMRATFVWV